MIKFATATLLLVTLAGCGATTNLMGAPRLASSLKAMAATGGTMVVETASVQDGNSPNPGHLLPGSEDFTVTGHDGEGKFTIVLHAVNPGGELFVPKPTTVTLNGKAVAPSEFNTLGSQLRKAQVTRASDKNVVMRAWSILQLSR